MFPTKMTIWYTLFTHPCLHKRMGEREPTKDNLGSFPDGLTAVNRWGFTGRSMATAKPRKG